MLLTKPYLLSIYEWLPALRLFSSAGLRYFQTLLSRCLFKVSQVFILLLLLVTAQTQAQSKEAQQTQTDYKKAVTGRVVKIVNTLQLTDSAKYEKVVSVIVDQYSKVNAIHEEATAIIGTIKAQPLSKAEVDSALAVQDKNKTAKLLQQHQVFIHQLEEHLTTGQVEQIKDGMTYRVFPITYTAYQDMIPSLKPEEKQKIYDWLKEARELAMDAESADKKHAVFGKYKGRINNYLSAQGYDSKKEREAWEARLKAKKDAAKSSN